MLSQLLLCYNNNMYNYDTELLKKVTSGGINDSETYGTRKKNQKVETKSKNKY